ncbi:MAG TPA: hypothetical protein VHB97_18015, partial [Polyangia bacterium]|nr:hypothetical protein [Polyangia bacterium]
MFTAPPVVAPFGGGSCCGDVPCDAFAAPGGSTIVGGRSPRNPRKTAVPPAKASPAMAAIAIQLAAFRGGSFVPGTDERIG